MSGPARRGVRRGRRRRSASEEMTRARRPEARTAQGKPTWGMRYWIVAGRKTLPIPFPEAEMASARDRCESK